jgi:uncharacterized membrane protein HdeD (DUF308 family)
MAFWVTLLRSLGFYWVSAGIMSVRWNASGERAGKLTITLGIIGILAGLAVVSRNLTANLFGEALVVAILGGVIVLTGLLHIFFGFRPREGRHRRLTSSLLGVFEVILGLILFIEPLERRPILNGAAMVWALLGGAILMYDAFRIRRLQQMEKDT